MANKKKQQVSGLWLNNLDDLAFAFTLSAATILIGFLLRKALSTRGLWIRPSYKKVIYEAIATAELTVVSFELCFIVYEEYNVFFYLLGTFLYSVWTTTSSNRPNQQMMANPVEAIAQYLKGEMRFEMSVIVIFAQTVGAVASYFLIVSPVWSYAWWWCFWKEDNVHTQRISSGDWTTAIITEDPVISALSEGIVTCLMYLTSVVIEGLGLDAEMERYSSIFIKTILVGIGTPYCGGYFNPAMASGLEYLTTGATMSTKIWVYWVSPILGIVIALLIEPLITPK